MNDKKETFPDYYNKYRHETGLMFSPCSHTWNHQQKKLDKANERILELEKILGDFISTTECKREWVDEMQATIESVLEQHIGEE